MSKSIKVQVTTGWANGTHTDYWELPDNWNKMSEDEQQDYLSECADEYLHECCGGYAEVVDEEE